MIRCIGRFARKVRAPKFGREAPHDDKCLAPEASARSTTTLEQSTLDETNDFAAGHQQVVHYTNIYEVEDAFQSLRDLLVCRTKMVVLAWVIMNQCDVKSR